MDLQQLMKKRKSARRFLDRPVSRSDVEGLIRCAGMAPSAINLQPWEYVVTHGDEKDRLIRRLLKVHAMKQVPCGPGTDKPLPQRYGHRSREALDIMRPRIDELNIPFNRFIEEGSCSFYGAPIVIFVLIDKIFPVLRYLDIGLSVSYLLLAAEAKGLSTCPIGLITDYGEEIKDSLNIHQDKKILLAVALGYAQDGAPENDFDIPRVPLSEIVTWYE